MAQQVFDVVVIGAGPGGYIAAIRAAQLGFSVACVDAFKNEAGQASLGGTCLNVGCIPSKALLESSENYAKVQHEFALHGITTTGVAFDASVMQKRKAGIVTQLTGGIAYLFKKNKVTSVHGYATLLPQVEGKWQIAVSDHADTLAATHVIIATGSTPRALPNVETDNINILDNTGALALSAVPARLGVIGAGVIGLEMGSVWKRLGSAVTILEGAPSFLGAADEEIAKEGRKAFTKQGLSIETSVKIGAISQDEQGVSVAYQTAEGKDATLQCDKLIVAIGRVPNTQNLIGEGVNLALDARGFIVVDDECRASLPNVWAIGDVVRGPMLAHKSSEEGVAVAERIAGQHPHISFDTVPWVIYTHPEMAWVGKTEQQLKADGVEYRKGKSSFAANGRALGMQSAEGFIKMLACAKTDRILGVHIIGPYASELISEAVVAMEFGASSEDIARIVHAHPSLSEVMHEAALSVDKRALHS